MIPPKGKAAMLIIAHAKPKMMKEEEPSMMEEGEEESGYEHELDIIADDLLQAVERKDKEGVVAALKAFKSCIRKEDEEQDMEHEAEETPEEEKEEHSEEYEG